MRPFYVHMFAPKAAYLMAPWLPGQARAVDHAVDWIRAGLPPDQAWEALFRSVMMHGRSGIRIFPRVCTATELAPIRARTLLILGDRERIYPPDQAARAARRLMPGIEVQIVADGHHITALAQPDRVSAILLHFLSDHAN
jgi:pimeloyl-ACP methyl ester carboxylesterase